MTTLPALSEVVQQAGAWALVYLYCTTFLGRCLGFNNLEREEDEHAAADGIGCGELPENWK